MLPTASKIPLLQHCQHWARSDVNYPYRDAGPSAQLGTDVHAAIERTLLTGEIQDVSADVEPYYLQWVDGWYSKHSGQPWQPEMKFSLNLDDGTASHIESGSDRNYPRAHNAIYGTADAVSLVGPDCVHVIDFKTGFRPVPVSQNAQLMTLALMAAKVYGAKSALVSIVQISTDKCYSNSDSLDDLDMGAWFIALREMARSIPGSEPVPGDHCRKYYCRGLGLCSATANALSAVAPSKPRLPIVTEWSAIQSADHASEQLLFIRYAEERLKLAKNAVREWADMNGGVRINGKTWARHEVVREDIELDGAAVALIGSMLGEYTNEALTYETSKAAIKRAAQKYAAKNGGTIASIERKILELLRSNNYITQKKSARYEER